MADRRFRRLSLSLLEALHVQQPLKRTHKLKRALLEYLLQEGKLKGYIKDTCPFCYAD